MTFRQNGAKTVMMSVSSAQASVAIPVGETRTVVAEDLGPAPPKATDGDRAVTTLSLGVTTGVMAAVRVVMNVARVVMIGLMIVARVVMIGVMIVARVAREGVMIVARASSTGATTVARGATIAALESSTAVTIVARVAMAVARASSTGPTIGVRAATMSRKLKPSVGAPRSSPAKARASTAKTNPSLRVETTPNAWLTKARPGADGSIMMVDVVTLTGARTARSRVTPDATGRNRHFRRRARSKRCWHAK
jgi:hypothetical protein